MQIGEQVRIIEVQIYSKHANFNLLEKMQHMVEYFGNDPEYSKEAMDIVRSNICHNMKKDS